MKSGLIATAAAVLIFPYSSLIPGPSAGNPNVDAYLGQAGSVYDAAANPPQTIGVVSYDPMAPLPASTSGIPAPGSSAIPATPRPR